MDHCLLCSETIHTKICKCIKCDILLHDYCEENYRGEKKYFECPNCHRIGTLTIFYIKCQDFLD